MSYCHRCKVNKPDSYFVGKYEICWDCRRVMKYKFKRKHKEKASA